MGTVTSVKIKSIKPCGLEDVYNMEVKEHHNFSICGGLIVHNSLDEMRYYIMSKPELKEQEIGTATPRYISPAPHDHSYQNGKHWSEIEDEQDEEGSFMKGWDA